MKIVLHQPTNSSSSSFLFFSFIHVTKTGKREGQHYYFYRKQEWRYVLFHRAAHMVLRQPCDSQNCTPTTTTILYGHTLTTIQWGHNIIWMLNFIYHFFYHIFCMYIMCCYYCVSSYYYLPIFFIILLFII